MAEDHIKEWDRVAELMIIKFGESGHPIFRDTSPLSRGTLKSKGGEKLSVHFCADGETVVPVFRTMISVNQFSIYGAVSDLCGEYKACHVKTGRPVMTGQSDPLFEPACFLTNTRTHLHLRPMILRKKIYCNNVRNELKSYHNKTVWLNFVLMQDS